MPTREASQVRLACGRTFNYRKKWEKCWDQVRRCSDQCRGEHSSGRRSGGRRSGGRRSGGRRSSSMNKAIEAALLELANERGVGRTLCPSEVARRLWPDAWREHMEDVRCGARRLAHRGALQISQHGRAVDPDDFRGPIRVGLPDSSTSAD